MTTAETLARLAGELGCLTARVRRVRREWAAVTQGAARPAQDAWLRKHLEEIGDQLATLAADTRQEGEVLAGLVVAVLAETDA